MCRSWHVNIVQMTVQRPAECAHLQRQVVLHICSQPILEALGFSCEDFMQNQVKAKKNAGQPHLLTHGAGQSQLLIFYYATSQLYTQRGTNIPRDTKYERSKSVWARIKKTICHDSFLCASKTILHENGQSAQEWFSKLHVCLGACPFTCQSGMILNWNPMT